MAKQRRTAIVDADIIAFRAAAGAQEWTDWGDGSLDGARWTAQADGETARKHIDISLEEIRDDLEADEVICCITDNVNWRQSVLPTYKGNRKEVEKPILLPQAREYLREKYGAWQRPGLEGDDLLGILSGLHERFPGEKVMVTIDKDMSTLPGLHYRLHQTVLGIFEVTEQQADMFHLKQGIAGDVTDGYKGCPGWGMDTAERYLEDPFMFVAEEYTPKSGKNAGIEQTRWVKREAPSLWEGIVSLYAKAGLTEQDAIVQMQVARILRTTDYDFKKKEPILWQPTLLSSLA